MESLKIGDLATCYYFFVVIRYNFGSFKGDKCKLLEENSSFWLLKRGELSNN